MGGWNGVAHFQTNLLMVNYPDNRVGYGWFLQLIQ